jgi:hypothetical protein
MGTTRLSTQTKDISTSDGAAVNTHVHRRTAILSGSALALTALMARSEAVFAQQTDQGNEPTARPNPIVRRVVTGTNSQGHSYALMDGNLTQGFGPLTQVWVTDRVPASNTETKDNADRQMRLDPPQSGVNFLYFSVAPQSESTSVSAEQMEKGTAAFFDALGAGHDRVDTSRNVGMHRTRTVDYIIVLSGEVDLLLDDGEVHLKPFDVVIQRGTNHAWVNRGTEKALLGAVLIDAEPGT